VADGEAVDWSSAERILPDEQRGVMRALRTIADSGAETTQGTTPLERSSPRLAVPPWLWLILGLGACQVLLGLIGLVLGTRGAGPSAGILERAAMLAFGGTAVWLARGGFRDQRALWLAGVLIAIASAFADGPANELASSRGWLLAGHPWWRVTQVEGFLPFCLWSFVRSFPRVLHLERTERLIRLAIGVTAAVGIAAFVLNLATAFGAMPEPARRWGPAGTGSAAVAYWGLIAALAAPALPLSFLRSRSAAAGERRRVARFGLGLALGLGPMGLEILAEALVPAFRRSMDDATAWAIGSLIVFPPLLCVPVLTAHAVVADRLLAVRPLLGRAARYLLARTTLFVLMAAPLFGLVAYLYERRAQPLVVLVSGPEGLLLLSTSAAGVLLLASRGRLSRRLDALFERSRADWPRLRLRAGEVIRRGDTTREAAATLMSELAQELQIEAAALLVATRDQRWFVPLTGQVRPLRGDSALYTLTAAEPTPLSTDPRDPESVFSLLPIEDQRWIVDTQAALLVPLAGADGDRTGLLALSAKRSETLFTEDELWEISSIGRAVGLALENKGLHGAVWPGSPRPDDEELPATECPRCWRVHAAEIERCGCGTPLVVAPLPRILLGKLELQERLGEGGMGLVYRALDRVLERSVAVKTLPRVSQGATERLRQEARSMAAVSHPGVAVIYGVESWQGLPFLVVEHLAGGTLSRRLRSPWPVAEALHLGIGLADALDAIHRRGLLHRDVKPSNIGFDGEAHPKLLDFGLARLVGPVADSVLHPVDRPWGRLIESAATRSWGPAGTPLYLSPEVLAGDPPNPQQDLWGLSLILFELIAGAHPFRSRGLQRTLDNVRNARLDDLRKSAPSCPEPVAAFFARALQRDVGKRPASASALRAELQALVSATG